MGRQNTSSYDDILLQKTKAIICQVLDNLNQHQEIQDVQVLSGRETIERWDNDTSIIPSQGSSQVEKRVWPVTFEQFVEHLDGQDRFVKNLAELLVSETVRKAIQKSVEGFVHTKYERDASPPLLRSEVGWQREREQSRKIRGRIDKLTRANRQNDTWDEEYSTSWDSSSSSESTLDQVNVLPLNSIPRAPPSVLHSDRQESTTRSTRMDRRALLRRSMMSERARMMRQRQELLQESRQWRRSSSRNEQGRREEMGRLRRLANTNVEPGSSSNSEASRPSTGPFASSSFQSEDPTETLIHRFLTQPFPSDGRNSTLESPRREDQGASSRTTVDPSTIEPSSFSRLGEFESFANSRRHSRRIRGTHGVEREDGLGDVLDDNRQVSLTEEGDTARENETFYRALDTLFRADETIRLVSQENEEAESTSHARRYDLPTLHEIRPVLRLPNRSTRREE